MNGIMQGKRGLIMGVANNHSIAWGISKALAAQGADAVCGTIGVIDWDIHGTDAAYLRADFDGTYSDIDGHAHIHGANLGVSAEAYRRAGGFEPLASEEDVALVAALRRVGATVVFSAAPKVWTSARIDSRARGGFGDAIRIALARNGAQG